MNRPKIGFITCVHPIYKLPAVISHRDAAVAGIEAAGCDVVVPESARDSRDVPEIVATLKRAEIDLLVYFFCTWVAEEITLSLALELRDVPLLLWALPYFDKTIPMPSPMTGLTATGCNMRRMGRTFLHRVGPPDAEQTAGVARTARIAALIKGLRQARFGMVGTQCPGMIDTGCDESLLQRKLGVTAIHRDLDNLLRAASESSEQEARGLAEDLVSRVGVSDVPVERVADQFRLYLGMKSMVEADRMDGFSVRCWPELRDHHKRTICLTMSEMAERGVPAACEADLTSLVTSHILKEIAGQPSYSLEITGYLAEERALQLAHCGAAPISMAGDPANASIRGHMRTGAGALIEFAFKPGTITLAKLLRPTEGRLKLFIGRGEVIPAAPGTRGSVAIVRPEPHPDGFLEIMLNEAVEHHLILVYGDWTRDLTEFARLADIEVIESFRR